MNFGQMSDGIRLHPDHEVGHHSARGATWLDSSPHSAIDAGDNNAGDGGNGSFFGAAVHAPLAMFNPLNAALASFHGGGDAHQSNAVWVDQDAVQFAGMGGNGGTDNTAAGGSVSAVALGFGSGDTWLGSGMIKSGTNAAGNGGDGYFYGGIIHAAIIIYEPINITVAVGYDSSTQAEQTNNVSFDQSAIQIAGVGGNGGNGNTAAGGDVGISSAGSGVISTGGNSAGNGGDGHFFGTLLHAPVVVYHPINIAKAGAGGTADASQSNTVEIDQSAIQIAGVGGNGGNGNAAIGGNVSTHGSAPGGLSDSGIDMGLIQIGGGQAGNGGSGDFYGGLVHASFMLYDPVNIAVAGYNSTAHAYQTNNVHLDQSSVQTAGVGGNGGNGNAAVGGNGGIALSGVGGGSDAIATGGNSAGNGGSGYFSGSLVDVSIAIYAPINIAIAGPHSTADADQINSVLIDQSAVQIAGIGGHGGDGNLALGGDLAAHLLSDLIHIG